MSYIRPDAAAVNLVFGGAYTRPAANAVDVAFPIDSYTADGAVTVDFAVAGDAVHGVAGDGAITVDFTVAGEAAFTSNVSIFDGAVTVDFTVAGDAAHGVAADGAVTVGISAAGDAAHGVAADGAVTVTFDVAGDFMHPRYEVRGQVQQGGVLINRRVRVYRRDTGDLVGEGETAFGKFQVTTGFAEREHYVIPINLADDATDWAPPVANRVVSVLAQD